MLVLVEGPDGAGKTQLSETLSHDYGLAYQHNGPPPSDNAIEMFWWQLQGLIAGQPGATIVDRSWPSAQVYHRLTNRVDPFHALAHRMFERVLLTHGGVIVRCLPPYHVAHDTWQQRALAGKELLTETWQFADTYRHYELWTSSVPTIRYDFTTMIAKELWHRIQGLDLTSAPDEMAGNVRGRVLIIGEQYSDATKPAYPFVGPGQHGFFLSNELDWLGVPEVDIAWVNARRLNDVATSYDTLRAVRPWVVIALGQEALGWWNGRPADLGQPKLTVPVPHPAYWNRFKHHEPFPLRTHREDIHRILGARHGVVYGLPRKDRRV